MTPYYERGGIVLYHGDCLDVLPLRVDAVVTDPPYGISDSVFTGGTRRGKRVGGDNTWHPQSDWDKFIDPHWGRAVSASADLIAWFGHWRKRTVVEEIISHPIRCEIVWAKNCHMGPPCPVAMRDERIWVLSATGVAGQHFETSVWDEPIIPTWAKKAHKNEKPLRLMIRLVRWLCTQDAIILDPFAGSGTTLVAAHRMGRSAIGVEREEANCETIAKRLEQEVLPLEASA